MKGFLALDSRHFMNHFPHFYLPPLLKPWYFSAIESCKLSSSKTGDFEMRAPHPTFLVVLLVFNFVQQPPCASALSVTFLNVQNGSCTILKGIGGKTIMVDAGGVSVSEFSTLVQFGLQLDTLHTAIVTQYDNNHLEDIPWVVSNLNPSFVFDRGGTGDNSLFPVYQTSLADRRHTIQPGQIIGLDEETTITCVIVDGKTMDGRQIETANEGDRSIGLLVKSGDFDLFLAGDLSSGVEDKIAELVGDVDLLLLSNHGSRTSSSRYFLDTIRPEVAVISVGQNNTARLPHQPVLDRLFETTSIKAVVQTNTGNGGTHPFVKVSNGNIGVGIQDLGSITQMSVYSSSSSFSPFAVPIQAPFDGDINGDNREDSIDLAMMLQDGMIENLFEFSIGWYREENSITPSPTFTPTFTFTPSITPTPSSTKTHTPTNTKTSTPTRTPSNTPTRTPTPTNTPRVNNPTPTRTLAPTPTPGDSDVVVFADPNLEAAVREEIEKAEGPIFKSDLYDMTFLIASDRSISSLEGLQNATDLEFLSIWGNQISDLSPLGGLVRLTYLNASQNHISDLDPIQGLTDLEDLHLNSNDLSSITAVSNFNRLEWLDVGDNQISDISAIANLTRIYFLIISQNQITSLQAIKDLQDLEFVSAWSNDISSVPPLSKLTRLENLNLSSNQVSSISGLSGLANLTDLDLGRNQISDISSLSNLTRLDFLVLSSNNISNISALSGLTMLSFLSVSFNDVTNIQPLVSNSGLGAGDQVLLYGNPLNETSINVHIPALESRGVDVSRKKVLNQEEAEVFRNHCREKQKMMETLRQIDVWGFTFQYY